MRKIKKSKTEENNFFVTPEPRDHGCSLSGYFCPVSFQCVKCMCQRRQHQTQTECTHFPSVNVSVSLNVLPNMNFNGHVVFLSLAAGTQGDLGFPDTQTYQHMPPFAHLTQAFPSVHKLGLCLPLTPGWPP